MDQIGCLMHITASFRQQEARNQACLLSCIGVEGVLSIQLRVGAELRRESQGTQLLNQSAAVFVVQWIKLQRCRHGHGGGWRWRRWHSTEAAGSAFATIHAGGQTYFSRHECGCMGLFGFLGVWWRACWNSENMAPGCAELLRWALETRRWSRPASAPHGWGYGERCESCVCVCVFLLPRLKACCCSELQSVEY